MNTDAHAPVTVAEAQGEVEAQLLLRFLEARGIRAILRGEALRNVHGLTMNGLGHVEIQVAPADAARARRLVSDLRAGRFQLEEGVDPSGAGEPGPVEPDPDTP